MINKLWTITLFFLLISLATAAVNIGETPEDIRGVVIQYPTISSSSGGGGSGSNVTSINSGNSCIKVDPSTGEVIVTYNETCSYYEKAINAFNHVSTNLGVDGFIVLDDENRKDDDYYSHTTGTTGDRSNITVLRDGYYDASYFVCVTQQGDTSADVLLESRFVINGTILVEGSRSFEIFPAGLTHTKCIDSRVNYPIYNQQKISVRLIATNDPSASFSQIGNSSSVVLIWSGEIPGGIMP